MGKYDEAYNYSLADPEGFWSEAAEAIHWEKKWDKIIDDSNPPFYRWFVGAKCNTCYNAVDSCLLYTSPSPRDGLLSRMPSSA